MIRRDSYASGVDGGGVTSLTFAHTCSGEDRLLVVYVGVDSGSDPLTIITGATYDGVAMSLVIDARQGNGLQVMFYLVAPHIGNHNVVISLAFHADNYVEGLSVSYKGVKQFGQPDRTNNKGYGGSDFPTDMTPILDNCWIVMGVYCDKNNQDALTNCIELISLPHTSLYDTNGPVTGGSPYTMTVHNDDSGAAWASASGSFSPNLAGGAILNL